VNPSVRRFQLRIELGIAQSQFSSSYTLKVSPYIPSRASFDDLSLTVSPQVIYNFYNAENFKFYGGAGVVLRYFRISNAYFGSQSQPNSASDMEANDPYAFTSAQNAFLFKLGFQIHKNWGFFAQYTTAVPITGDSYWALSSKCEQIGINYYFW